MLFQAIVESDDGNAGHVEAPSLLLLDGRFGLDMRVLDLYNGEIVAYQTSRSPQFQMVDSMLKKAISTLKGTVRPMLHSDRHHRCRNPSWELPQQAGKSAEPRSGNELIVTECKGKSGAARMAGITRFPFIAFINVPNANPLPVVSPCHQMWKMLKGLILNILLMESQPEMAVMIATMAKISARFQNRT